MVEQEKAPRGDSFGKKDVGEFDHGQQGSGYQQIISSKTVGWKQNCTCTAAGGLEPVPGLVFDPFLGAGTTAWVAKELGRRSAGCELNPAYVEIARKRLKQESLFLQGE